MRNNLPNRRRRDGVVALLIHSRHCPVVPSPRHVAGVRHEGAFAPHPADHVATIQTLPSSRRLRCVREYAFHAVFE